MTRRRNHFPQTISRHFRESKAAFLQLLVAAAQKSTFDRIIDCPTYPVPARTRHLGDGVRELRAAMQSPDVDLATWLAQLYSTVRSVPDRKRVGQFFTSSKIADWALQIASPGLAERICDAGSGAGVFSSALVRSTFTVESYLGIENDPILALCGAHVLESMNAPSSFKIWYANFLMLNEDAFNRKGLQLPTLVISNPPFVRYHHLAGRTRLRGLIRSSLGITLSPFSGSGSYFLSRAAELVGLRENTQIGDRRRMLFFTPTEAAGAAHAQQLRKDLNTLHHWTHSVLPVPDGQTGVDNHASNAIGLLFIFEQMRLQRKTSKDQITRGHLLGDLLQVRRGISTGKNDFFVLNDREVDARKIDRNKWLKKVLPTRIRIAGTVFSESAWEELRQSEHPCWLLALPNVKIDRLDVPIQEYLREGLRRGLHLTTTAKSLRTWFSLPIPDQPPDIFITYFFRGAPRFILNEAGVFNLTNILGGRIKTNLCGVTDKTALVGVLNQQAKEWMVHDAPGREYKGGLRKIEPRELSRLVIPSHILKSPYTGRPANPDFTTLFDLVA